MSATSPGQSGTSADRSISLYRQILLLPLVLRFPDPKGRIGSPEKVVDDIAERLVAKGSRGGQPRWREIENRIEHMGPIDADAYGEFLYFHRFIQQFLYGPAKTEVGDPSRTLTAAAAQRADKWDNKGLGAQNLQARGLRQARGQDRDGQGALCGQRILGQSMAPSSPSSMASKFLSQLANSASRLSAMT